MIENSEEKLRELCCYGDIEAVENLIKKGVEINSQNKMNGWTALHWAAKRNHMNVVKVYFKLSTFSVKILGMYIGRIK